MVTIIHGAGHRGYIEAATQTVSSRIASHSVSVPGSRNGVLIMLSVASIFSGANAPLLSYVPTLFYAAHKFPFRQGKTNMYPYKLDSFFKLFIF